MSDLICLTAEMAFVQHEKGNITREQLVRILERCVNAAALSNGYAEEHGVPFPEAES